MRKRRTTKGTVDLKAAPTAPRLPREIDYVIIDDTTGREEWGVGVIRDDALVRTKSRSYAKRKRGRKRDAG